MVRAKIIDHDLGWKAMLKAALQLAQGAYVKVGVLADSQQGEQKAGSGLTVAELAAVQEFGTEDGHVPERKPLRSTYDEQLPELQEMAGQILVKLLEGGVTVDQGLGMMGAKLASEIKKKITTGAGVPPPNAPSTVARKGSSRPLVDSGRLANSYTWQVGRGR